MTEHKLKSGKIVTVHHSPEEIAYVSEVVGDFKPKLVIELGTAQAGLTAVIHEAWPAAWIWTFDKTDFESEIKADLKAAGVRFIVKDILGEPYRPIRSLCKLKLKKILYCDNGHKITEVEHYGYDLIKGDLLGVHDIGREIFPHHIPAHYFSKIICNPELAKLEELGTTRFYLKELTCPRSQDITLSNAPAAEM